MREQRFQTSDGAELAWYERPGEGPPLVFVHAAGFHGRCWDQVAARLAGRRCCALDLRGHGRSAKPAPPYRWPRFAQDLAELGRALDLRGAVGVGHSLGGYAVALAAALAPEVFARLLLIDPVILPRALYGSAPPGEHFAARRRDRWPSPAAMYERFRDRPPFSRWRPEVLRDYCEHGLLPAPDGDGYVLACPPAVEASIYLSSAADDPYPHLAQVRAPALVLRAGQPARDVTDMEASPTAPDLAAHFPDGQDVHLPGYSHFLPMEDPELVARLLRDESAAAPC
jgi:pimeloyl-ACP methyl ester carboxylesterase